MKFVVSILSLLLSTATASVVQHKLNDVPADSEMGMALLGKARRVEENWNEENQQQQEFNYEDMFENTWVAGYSIKFQGCHHISQWNRDADNEDDVRIVTKRLVRFRLCPSSFCSAGATSGCSSGYGDYVIDLNTYLETYLESKSAQNDAQQQYYEGQQQYYEQQAQYNGYSQQGQNQYQNGYNENMNQMYQQQYMNNAIETYMECTQADFGGGGRELQDNNYYYQQDQYNYNFYIGPYCASQGGAIYLGLFLDDTCTTFADNDGGRETYRARTGGQLPYGEESIVDTDCIPCMENEDNWNNNNQDEDGEENNYYSNYYDNDQQDRDQVSELCENIYEKAGKCEANLPQGTVYEKNVAACNYMEGIKIVRNDGTVQTAAQKANRSAKTIMSLLCVAFIGLSAYVYFLKTKLERASINLPGGEE